MTMNLQDSVLETLLDLFVPGRSLQREFESSHLGSWPFITLLHQPDILLNS